MGYPAFDKKKSVEAPWKASYPKFDEKNAVESPWDGLIDAPKNAAPSTPAPVAGGQPATSPPVAPPAASPSPGSSATTLSSDPQIAAPSLPQVPIQSSTLRDSVSFAGDFSFTFPGPSSSQTHQNEALEASLPTSKANDPTTTVDESEEATQTEIATSNPHENAEPENMVGDTEVESADYQEAPQPDPVLEKIEVKCRCVSDLEAKLDTLERQCCQANTLIAALKVTGGAVEVCPKRETFVWEFAKLVSPDEQLEFLNHRIQQLELDINVTQLMLEMKLARLPPLELPLDLKRQWHGLKKLRESQLAAGVFPLVDTAEAENHLQDAKTGELDPKELRIAQLGAIVERNIPYSIAVGNAPSLAVTKTVSSGASVSAEAQRQAKEAENINFSDHSTTPEETDAEGRASAKADQDQDVTPGNKKQETVPDQHKDSNEIVTSSALLNTSVEGHALSDVEDNEGYEEPADPADAQDVVQEVMAEAPPEAETITTVEKVCDLTDGDMGPAEEYVLLGDTEGPDDQQNSRQEGNRDRPPYSSAPAPESPNGLEPHDNETQALDDQETEKSSDEYNLEAAATADVQRDDQRDEDHAEDRGDQKHEGQDGEQDAKHILQNGNQHEEKRDSLPYSTGKTENSLQIKSPEPELDQENIGHQKLRSLSNARNSISTPKSAVALRASLSENQQAGSASPSPAQGAEPNRPERESKIFHMARMFESKK